MPSLYPPVDLDRYRLELHALPLREVLEQIEFYGWELAELDDASDVEFREQSLSFVRFKLTELARERDRREKVRDNPHAPAWPEAIYRDPEAWSEVKRRLDLQQLIDYAAPGAVPGTHRWKRSGRTLVTTCPFGIHRDREPSFTLYPDQQSFFCYGCGIGGDVFVFAQTYWDLTRKEALILLAEFAALPKSTVPRAAPVVKQRRSILNGGTSTPAKG